MKERYHVDNLALFSSRARGDAREDSDIDIQVDFAPGADLLDLSRLKLYFEGIFGRPVDALADGRYVRSSGKQSSQMRLISDKLGGYHRYVEIITSFSGTIAGNTFHEKCDGMFL